MNPFCQGFLFCFWIIVKKGRSEHDKEPKTDYCLLKPRTTNFGKRWMNENRHSYFLDIEG